MARMGYSKFYYDLTVRQKTVIMPSDIKKALKGITDKDPFAVYPYRALIFIGPGAVEKKGEAYVFTAKGSNQAYTLDFEKPPESLSGAVTLTGFVSEPEAKEGEAKPRPVIEVEEIEKTK